MGPADDNIDLSRWVGALRHRKAMIATILVLTVAAALALSLLQKKSYQATAEIVLQANGDIIVLPDSPAPQGDPLQSIETAMKVVAGEQVRSAVRMQFGNVDKPSVNRLGDSFIIQVKARSEDRRRAVDIANAYARAYVDLRRQELSDEILAGVRPLEDRIADLQEQIEASGTGSDARRDSLIEQQEAFRQRVAELNVDASRAAASGRVVGAPLPTSPVSPTPVRNVILGFVVGLLGAISLALLLEYFDDSIDTIDDLSEVVAPMPVLGVIPEAGRRRRHRSGRHPLLAESDDAVSEAYRSLRTAILHLGIERPLTAIQVTSPAAADGKSTTVGNLGLLLAAAGQRVVLVDADLRRRKLNSLFGIDDGPGLTEALSGETEVADAIQPVPGQSGLHVLPAGRGVADPAVMLGSRAMSELVFRLQSDFDVVLVDSPPSLAVTDPVVLSSWVDATLIVVKARTTRARQLRATLRLLGQVDAPVVGVILNRADMKANYGYGYGYGYGNPPSVAPKSTSDPTPRAAAPTAGPRDGQGDGQTVNGVSVGRLPTHHDGEVDRVPRRQRRRSKTE